MRERWLDYCARSEDRILRAWQWFFARKRSKLNRALVLTLLGTAAFFLTGLLAPTFHFSTTPMIATLLMVLYGGAWLGLTFTTLLALAIDYYYIPPVHHLFVTSEARQHFLLVTLLSLSVGAFVSSLRFAFQRLELARNEADRAIKARDELLGVISHELKNPLTAIKAGIGLLQRVLPDTPENASARKMISRLTPSTQRMSRLVSDLLDVTRLEARALKLELGACDIREVVDDIRKAYEASAQEKVVELSAEIHNDAGLAYCDGFRTGQVLANLVSNAIKFTNEGGTIRVYAQRIGARIEISVRDTGKGIPAEFLPHVFDRFWQAKETAHRGTGLGLAIAKGIVEAQGGQIRIESEVGLGTTCTFTIPSLGSVTALDAKQSVC